MKELRLKRRPIRSGSGNGGLELGNAENDCHNNSDCQCGNENSREFPVHGQ
jgi:hypothetical protein